MRNIITYLKSKKHSKKNHEVRGNLIMKIVFEERSRWEDLIELYAPEMGLPAGKETCIPVLYLNFFLTTLQTQVKLCRL